MEIRNLNIELTQNEYSELLSKLANELESYGDSATTDFKNSFIKIADTELFELKNETTLVKKFKKVLL